MHFYHFTVCGFNVVNSTNWNICKNNKKDIYDP